MAEAGWTSNDHAINLYTYVLGYHPDQEALEAGDDKDYNAIKRALEHSYQRGWVAALDAVERYMAMRLRLAEESLATEILAGNEVKQGRERAAIAELHGMQGHVSDIKENIAQQAQEGGVGDGN